MNKILSNPVKTDTEEAIESVSFLCPRGKENCHC